MKSFSFNAPYSTIESITAWHSNIYISITYGLGVRGNGLWIMDYGLWVRGDGIRFMG